MSFKSFVLSAVTTLALATSASAEMAHMMVADAYARASNKMAGAAFMEIINHTGVDDRLIDVRSDVAKRVQLHTHKEDANGVMKMMHVEAGFAIAAGETHLLQRGGDHVMFMGLTRELKDGDMVNVTLVFDKAGEVAVQIPVDMERQPDAAHGGHGSHDAHDGHEDHSSHSN
ncbi:copper chaperone PCu(A)C [Phaeobacter sp. B1627]|uniref:copper chaperone PCu(A)C n=1 Tax=Phaeobacter sp. B1627 TaxID=2583809 RepID=UPI00111B312F|nr:copper chaperone PCu(A)C [Phaeobacter sp. B1627]TNJ48550.1 copper chaperone PCu(A)C [Phaeobacter sp. B1627]